MNNKYLFVFLFLISGTAIHAQTSLTDALQTYFTQWQKGEPTTSIKEKLLLYDGNDLLSEIERNTADTLAGHRAATYRLLSDVGLKLTNEKLRQRAVKQLVYGCNDRDGGIVGISLDNLTLFKRADFTPETKYILSEMVKKPIPHYDVLIKLCGWLQITDLIYDFRRMITENKATVRDRWAMRLAMARMGEQDMLDYCMQRVKRIPVNDDVVYDLVPDMIYTRQKPMFDYLLTMIESDEKNCTSSNPDSDAKIICAYRVMKQVAPYVENFPVKTDVAGELMINDYPEALAGVRAWIKENRGNYKIKDESF